MSDTEDLAAARVLAAAELAAARIVAAADLAAARVSDPLLLTMVRNTDANVEKLLHAMFEGNGEPPVLAQLATLRERTRNHGRQIAALFGLLVGIVGGSNFRL